jgi:hypothetical protein
VTGGGLLVVVGTLSAVAMGRSLWRYDSRVDRAQEKLS